MALYVKVGRPGQGMLLKKNRGAAPSLRKRSVTRGVESSLTSRRPSCLYGGSPSAMQTRPYTLGWGRGVYSFLMQPVSPIWALLVCLLGNLYSVGSIL